MKLNKYFTHLLELNFAVLLVSTSGALGKYIDLSVPLTILMRTIIASGILYAYCKFRGFRIGLDRGDRKVIWVSGVLLGLHWITYFYSLRLSNVAIGMLSLYTFPAITALLEPLMGKGKLEKTHLLLTAMILVGVYFLVPDLSFESDHFIAVCLGIVSAFCYALRNIMVKSKDHCNQSVVMFNQLVLISIVLLPSFFVFDVSLIERNLSYIIILATLTTAIGHTMFVNNLKHFSVTSLSIISSLQPVYGIIFGMIFLSDYPASSTIIGGVIIVSAALYESIKSSKK